MTRRRQLEQRRHSLSEAREIMSSMKALAYMETRKLQHHLRAQRGLVAQLEAIARDFLGFHRELLPEAEAAIQVYLLIGAERGFCGDFNSRLAAHWRVNMSAFEGQSSRLFVTGRKLGTLLGEGRGAVSVIEGVSVLEEVETTLGKIIDKLEQVRRSGGPLALTVLHHDPERGQIRATPVLPPFGQLRDTAPGLAQPPILNLAPKAFFSELVAQYLFATLHRILYVSLMAENIRRVGHLESAVKHLDRVTTDLVRRSNSLRQEEIIEEIEVILLSTVGPTSRVRTD